MAVRQSIIKKLERICGELERLQGSLSREERDTGLADIIGRSKRAALDALRLTEVI